MTSYLQAVRRRERIERILSFSQGVAVGVALGMSLAYLILAVTV